VFRGRTELCWDLSLVAGLTPLQKATPAKASAAATKAASTASAAKKASAAKGKAAAAKKPAAAKKAAGGVKKPAVKKPAAGGRGKKKAEEEEGSEDDDDEEEGGDDAPAGGVKKPAARGKSASAAAAKPPPAKRPAKELKPVEMVEAAMKAFKWWEAEKHAAGALAAAVAWIACCGCLAPDLRLAARGHCPVSVSRADHNTAVWAAGRWLISRA